MHSLLSTNISMHVQGVQIRRHKLCPDIHFCGPHKCNSSFAAIVCHCLQVPAYVMVQFFSYFVLLEKLLHGIDAPMPCGFESLVGDLLNRTLFVKLMYGTNAIMLCRFERLVGDLLNRTQQPCRDCMKDAGVAPTDINEVLLVGGMTRMPRVSPLPTIHFSLCCLSPLSHSAPPFMHCSLSAVLSLSFISFSPTLYAVFTSCCAVLRLCLT